MLGFVPTLSQSTFPKPHCDTSHPPFVTTQSKNHSFPYYDSSHQQPDEFLRARELLCYYCPPLAPLSRGGTPSPPAHSTEPESLADVPGDCENLLKSSDDPALLAFSQLLALRLDCERSMISLIGRTNQYILAEATRTLSITDPMQRSGLLVPDGLWMGCKTIPAEAGLGIHTIRLYPVDEDELSILEIPDLTLDPRFQNRDFVLNYPRLKFYAATPLRTKRGYNIGSLCVYDSSPRTLTMDERTMLGQMGKLVMRQLEMNAERNALLQNQRMAKILGRFSSASHDSENDENRSGLAAQHSAPVKEDGMCQRHGSPPITSFPEVTGDTLTETFSKASTLIRDALTTDGVLFLDADKAYDAIAGGEGVSGRENAETPLLFRRQILGHSASISRNEGEMKVDAGDMVEVKGRDHGKVPDDRMLQRMLKLYPLGTILSFDTLTKPQNSPASRATAEFSFSDGLSTSEDEIFCAVQNFLPDCASVLFMPLFNSSGKPYAASFSWTYDVRRVFTSDEVLYMQSFMSSITSELDRLKTISADNAKGEFIASISHELRSPLHGVLLSAELLSETSLDAFQRSFLDTIESCGRMLLDTINHVLDFQKLANLSNDRNAHKDRLVAEGGNTPVAQNHNASRPDNGGPSHGGVVSLVEATDISILTEQVVEGVCAGYEFQGITSPEFLDAATVKAVKSSSHENIGLLSNQSGLSNMRTGFQHAPEAVAVILDIEQRNNWTFVTQPGAIRRILMNIFANALKYTDSGWIRVHLKAEDLPLNRDDSTDTSKSKIVLTVSDSGRGISREFLKTKLFTPFSQEDNLTHGTGLGLSIVREIVRLLGGDIEVQSQVNVGTEIVVTLILEHPEEMAEVPNRHSGQVELALASQLRKHSVGKTICLTGVDPHAASADSDAYVLTSLRESLARYAQAWFGMHVVTGTLATEGVDIFLANESADLVRHLEERPNLEGQPITAVVLRTPLIVLCSNVSQYRGYVRQATNFPVLQFVSKPCGPIKLAKALLFCFETSHQLDVLAQSLASQSKLPAERTQRHMLPSPLPSRPTPETETVHDTVVTDGLNIRGAGFVTSSLARTRAPSPVPSKEKRSPTPNVLIVDDNPINLMVLAAFLQKKKYPFVKAANGLLGVQAVMATPEYFDVILMDMQMPVMSGFDAIRAIRKFEAENIDTMKRSLIIALTGLASIDDTDEAYGAGADLFLTKPVPFKVVDQELEKWKERNLAAAVEAPIASVLLKLLSKV